MSNLGFDGKAIVYLKKENGQILSLLCLLLGFLALLGLAITSSLFSASRKLSHDESEFLKLFEQQLTVAQKLNVIAENNLEIAELLNRIIPLYQTAVGFSLDLAASTPIWERQLPIPKPDNVFAAFQSAVPQISRNLNRLARLNTEAAISLPSNRRSLLRKLNLTESICLLFDKQRTIAAGATFWDHRISCQLSAQQSLLAMPQYRFFSDLGALNRLFGAMPGLTLIQIHNDLILQATPSSSANSSFQDSPFAQKKLVLTHASFCRVQAASSSRADCPKLQDQKRINLAEDHLASFFPNWTISVEDSKDEI